MRRCFLILGLTSALAVPLAALPAVAPAKPGSKKAEKKQNQAIKTNKQSLDVLTTKVTNLGTTVGTISAAVSTITSGAATIQTALTTIGSTLTTIGAGLTALKNAVQDPTTGLVGLNNARPQFGAFTSTGGFIAGTGANPPAKGPSGSASNPSAGKYIVDFGNDVSARFVSVTPFPTGALPVIASAVNCSVASMPCTGADTSPNHVLVLFQVGSGAPTSPANGFTVAAFSG
jgi:hypothetical protein